MATRTPRSSPELEAFLYFKSLLIQHVTNPAGLACQLCDNYHLITPISLYYVLSSQTTEEQCSLLLAAVEGRLRAIPYCFPQFIHLLYSQHDSTLEALGKQMNDHYDLLRNKYRYLPVPVTAAVGQGSTILSEAGSYQATLITSDDCVPPVDEQQETDSSLQESMCSSHPQRGAIPRRAHTSQKATFPSPLVPADKELSQVDTSMLSVQESMCSTPPQKGAVPPQAHTSQEITFATPLVPADDHLSVQQEGALQSTQSDSQGSTTADYCETSPPQSTMQDKEISCVDTSCVLTEDDLLKVYREVQSLAGYWRGLLLCLRIPPSERDIIAATYPNDPRNCLLAVIEKWLKRNYDFKKYGPPTWKKMLEAVTDPIGGNNHALALEIAKNQVSHSVREQIDEFDVPALKRPRLTTDLQQSLHNSPTPERTSRLLATTTSDESSSMAHLPASRCQQATSSKLLPPAKQPQVDSDSALKDCGQIVKQRYMDRPEIQTDYWPPVRGMKFINLALLKKCDKVPPDDYTMYTFRGSADDEVIGKKEQVSFEKLFSMIGDGERLLMEGRPGSGKTTLMNKVSRDWAQGLILQNIVLLLLVPLRKFRKKADIGLVDFVKVHTGHTYDTVTQEIFTCEGKGICIVLDGIDEYPFSTVPDNFIMELMQKNLLQNATVIVTSRPAASVELREHATKRTEVLGFLQSQIELYIQHSYPKHPERASQLTSYLSCHPNIRYICYLPLHLAMIVYLNNCRQESDDSLPRTETEVYVKFTLYTLLRHLQKKAQARSPPRLLNFSNLPADEHKVFQNVCRLAYEATLQSELLFSKGDIEEVVGDDSFHLDSLGLLTIDQQFCECGLEETYSFLHLTFQEFLCAVHISKLPREKQLLVAKDNGAARQMSVAWKFYSGLTHLQQESSSVFQQVTEQSKKPLHLVHCVHESQNPKACIELLKNLNGQLVVEDETLTSADCSALAYCLLSASSSIEELRICSCTIRPEEFGILAPENNDLLCLRSLKRLCIVETSVLKKAVPALCRLLLSMQHLQELELSKCSIRPQTLQKVASALTRLQELQTLSLQNNGYLSGNEDVVLQTLESLQQLRKLRLDAIGDMDKIFHRLPVLKTLRLDGKRISVEVTKTPEGCFKARLIHLKQDVDVAQDDCDTISKSTLRVRVLSPEGCAAVSTFLRVHPDSIKSIDLDKFGIGDGGVKALGEGLRHCTRLENLILSRNTIGDGGLEGLIQGLQYCTSLQKLDLHYNSITDGSADHLSQLGRALPSLKELDLSANSIGDGGLEGLIQGLQYCTSLQTLELQYNSITDDSADHLAQLGRALPSLTYLNLGRNSIGDRELEGLLEGLQHCSSLQELYLYNTNISDDSVKQLAQFVRDLPSLKTLCIQQNKLSDRGKDVLKQIKKDRPGLIIYT